MESFMVLLAEPHHVQRMLQVVAVVVVGFDFAAATDAGQPDQNPPLQRVMDSVADGSLQPVLRVLTVLALAHPTR